MADLQVEEQPSPTDVLWTPPEEGDDSKLSLVPPLTEEGEEDENVKGDDISKSKDKSPAKRPSDPKKPRGRSSAASEDLAAAASEADGAPNEAPESPRRRSQNKVRSRSSDPTKRLKEAEEGPIIEPTDSKDSIITKDRTARRSKDRSARRERSRTHTGPNRTRSKSLDPGRNRSNSPRKRKGGDKISRALNQSLPRLRRTLSRDSASPNRRKELPLRRTKTTTTSVDLGEDPDTAMSWTRERGFLNIFSSANASEAEDDKITETEDKLALSPRQRKRGSAAGESVDKEAATIGPLNDAPSSPRRKGKRGSADNKAPRKVRSRSPTRQRKRESGTSRHQETSDRNSSPSRQRKRGSSGAGHKSPKLKNRLDGSSRTPNGGGRSRRTTSKRDPPKMDMEGSMSDLGVSKNVLDSSKSELDVSKSALDSTSRKKRPPTTRRKREKKPIRRSSASFNEESLQGAQQKLGDKLNQSLSTFGTHHTFEDSKSTLDFTVDSNSRNKKERGPPPTRRKRDPTRKMRRSSASFDEDVLQGLSDQQAVTERLGQSLSHFSGHSMAVSVSAQQPRRTRNRRTQQRQQQQEQAQLAASCSVLDFEPDSTIEVAQVPAGVLNEVDAALGVPRESELLRGFGDNNNDTEELGLDETQKKKKKGVLSALTGRALKSTLRYATGKKKKKKDSASAIEDDSARTDDDPSALMVASEDNRSGDGGAGGDGEMRWQRGLRPPSGYFDGADKDYEDERRRQRKAASAAAAARARELDLVEDEEREQRRRKRREAARAAAKQAAREARERKANQSTDGDEREEAQAPRRRMKRSEAAAAAAAARMRARRESTRPGAMQKSKRSDSQSAAAEAAARARMRARKKGISLGDTTPTSALKETKSDEEIDEERSRELQHKKFMEAAIKSAEAKTRKKELAKKLGSDAARAASTRKIVLEQVHLEEDDDGKRGVIRKLSNDAAQAASTRHLGPEHGSKESSTPVLPSELKRQLTGEKPKKQLRKGRKPRSPQSKPDSPEKRADNTTAEEEPSGASEVEYRTSEDTTGSTEEDQESPPDPLDDYYSSAEEIELPGRDLGTLPIASGDTTSFFGGQYGSQ